MYIVQDQPLPPSETLRSYYRLFQVFTRFIREIRSFLSRGILDRYATIATYTVQADDEESGILGGQH
jgi:hypothetical protein